MTYLMTAVSGMWALEEELSCGQEEGGVEPTGEACCLPPTGTLPPSVGEGW